MYLARCVKSYMPTSVRWTVLHVLL